MDTTHSDSALTLNARSPFLAYAHCKFLLNGGILRPAAFRQTLNVTRERIVAKVDTLFGHLDQLRSRLDKIPVLLKQFRQAVLTQAVTGKLTGNTFKEVKLGDYLTELAYGTAQKCTYGGIGVGVLRIPNIVDGEINISDLKYTTLNRNEENKLLLRAGDVLMIRSNGSRDLVGRSAIVRENHVNLAYAGYLIRLRPTDDLIPEFLNYCLASDPLRKQIHRMAHSTSGVNNINTNQIQQLTIPLPSLHEQRQAVNVVQRIFTLGGTLERRYDHLASLIDAISGDILFKQFRQIS